MTPIPADFTQAEALWPRDAAVAKLTRQCVENMPARRWAHIRDTLSGPVHGWQYSRRDPRVRELVRLHEAACERAMDDYAASRISRDECSAELFTTADDVIEAAFEAAQHRRIAA